METKYLNIYALYLFKWASAIEVSGSLKKIVMYRLNSVTKELFHVSFCLVYYCKLTNSPANICDYSFIVPCTLQAEPF